MRFGRASHVIFEAQNQQSAITLNTGVNETLFEPENDELQPTRQDNADDADDADAASAEMLDAHLNANASLDNGVHNGEVLGLRHIRVRRHLSSGNKVPRVLHIETAIFVDRDLFRHMEQNYPEDTESKLIRFVLAMINGVCEYLFNKYNIILALCINILQVQLLYHHPSLGHQINFVLKRLEILHSDPKELRRSSDIDIFLNSFCLWQRKINPVSDADVVHFDHAVILTGWLVYSLKIIYL